MRYMNDVFLDGIVKHKIKMGIFYYFTLYQPIYKMNITCKTMLREFRYIKEGDFIGVHGTLEKECFTMIKVHKIKVYE